MRLKKIVKSEEWFDVPNDDGSFLIRNLASGDIAEIMDVATLFNSAFDKEEFRRGYITRHIVDWKKMEDEDGKPLDLTQKNKLLFLMQEYQDENGKFKPMADYVWKCINVVREKTEKQRGEAEKN